MRGRKVLSNGGVDRICRGGLERWDRGEQKGGLTKDDDRWSAVARGRLGWCWLSGGWVGGAGGQSWRAVDGSLEKQNY